MRLTHLWILTIIAGIIESILRTIENKDWRLVADGWLMVLLFILLALHAEEMYQRKKSEP